MANMLFTTFGILSPMAYNLFLILAVVGFFGVYIPWNERKKKQGGQKSAESFRMRRKPSAPMSRAQALVRMVFYLPVLTVGLTRLIASSVMGEPLLIALGGGLTIVSLLGMERAGKEFRAGKLNRSVKPPKPAFRPEAPDHEHITITDQGDKARLEQLDTLKNAGLISDQEYRQKRQEILNKP